MMHQKDTQVINRILEGDISGYAVLVDKYKDLAFTIAFRILNNRENAEEVVQDAYLKAFRNLAGFRNLAKFSTWFYRIVYNTAISRKRLKVPDLLSFEDIPYLDGKFEQAECTDDQDEERGQLLEKAMKVLPDDERTIVSLYYINDSSIEEIHVITGLTKANVKVKLFRARKRLQDFIVRTAQHSYV